MDRELPRIVEELDMNAEIGGYDAEDDREGNEPIVEASPDERA